MSIRIQYFIITLGLFIATFSTFFLLGDDVIKSIIYATINMGAFLSILYLMVSSGRWRW